MSCLGVWYTILDIVARLAVVTNVSTFCILIINKIQTINCSLLCFASEELNYVYVHT